MSESLFQLDTTTVSRILEAASSEFAFQGYEGVTLRGVAARAGVQASLVDYHYGDKETLWREAAAHLYGRLAERLKRLERESSGCPPRVRTRRLLIEFVIGCSDPRIARVAFDVRDSERKAWIQQHYARPIRDFIGEVVDDAQRHGCMAPGDPELHYKLLAGAGIVRSWRTDADGPADSAELDREAAALVDVLLTPAEGLGDEPQPQRRRRPDHARRAP